jgi:hypothetical protein
MHDHLLKVDDLNIIAHCLGNQHGCNMNSFALDVGEEAETTMVTNGETTASDCK